LYAFLFFLIGPEAGKQLGPTNPAKQKQVLLMHAPLLLQVVAALHEVISQVSPWNPGRQLHWPSPVTVLVVTQVPPFLQTPGTLQKATLVAHVGPLKPGAHLQLIVLLVGVYKQVPEFWQKLTKEAGQATVVVGVTTPDGRLQ